jgi:hypothetical protein
MRAKEFLSESKQLFEAALAKGDFGPQERKQDRIKNFIDISNCTKEGSRYN